MALSKNFEKEVLRREKPGCYGKFKDESNKKANEKPVGKIKCGTCWFNPYCRDGKTLPKKKGTAAPKVSEDK